MTNKSEILVFLIIDVMIKDKSLLPRLLILDLLSEEAIVNDLVFILTDAQEAFNKERPNALE